MKEEGVGELGELEAMVLRLEANENYDPLLRIGVAFVVVWAVLFFAASAWLSDFAGRSRSKKIFHVGIRTGGSGLEVFQSRGHRGHCWAGLLLFLPSSTPPCH